MCPSNLSEMRILHRIGASLATPQPSGATGFVLIRRGSARPGRRSLRLFRSGGDGPPDRD